jgi:hypothetical protein
MATAMSWLTTQRRKSLGGGLSGILLAIVAIAGLPHLLPVPARETAVAAAFLAPAAVVFILTLVVSLSRLLGHRFDPLNDPDSRTLAVSQRALTNSVEQGLVFALAAGTLAWTAEPVWRAAVPAMAIAFVLARAAFWLGYLQSTLARAPGMGATMATNVTAMLLAAWQAFGA